MSKEFIPYELALAMKELGFDNVPCLAVYCGDIGDELRSWGISQLDDNENFKFSHREQQYYAQKGFQNGILAPLYQQAFRWFREEYGIVHTIYKVKDDYVFGFDVIGSFHNNSTYEEAQDSCLRKLIEIVNQNKDENN